MKTTKLNRLFRPILLSIALAVPATAVATLPATAQIKISTFAQAIAEAASDDEDIAGFYRENGYQPIWTSGSDEHQARIMALFQAIQHADDHGLPERAFDTAALENAMRAIDSPRDLGRVEVDLSKLFLTYAKYIQTGILTPAAVDDGIKREVPLKDRTELLKAFSQAQPAPFLRTLPPKSEEYARLMREKLRLERVRAEGGWGPTVQAGSLRPGDQGQAVIQLRNRLVTMGYMDRSATQTYDENIQRAVQRFQTNHGLTADGVAGGDTVKAINTPVEDRLERIIVAMERERWMNIERGDRYVWVNLTTFTARVVDGGKVTFETRSVVGQNLSTHRTPEFSDMMEHMVINPSWYVPRSIIVNEYLPALRANSGAAGHLLITDARGRTVSRATDFSQYSARNFPFDMRQPPGPGNALGYVKFMFPNQYNIYLHDTPSKSLFGREVRTFSHGCVRLQQPFDFAYTMLAPQEADPEGFFQSILRTGQETKVELDEPVPVHLVYRTAFTDTRGEMNYRNDMYGRDARIWAALQAAGVDLRMLDS
ncbi:MULTISPECIES: L,D-transpeptidase family protein [Maritimibacter]|jgi:murein L,D-transpeptidase YcbB/YkuD|uniref:Peptidoglycan binding protein, putative n=1 Tax=Maritimibacter alkaliphilus HTCC2654 TaxID=314271 RepID=A3VDP2_9RHOB|nr:MULTISPECIES: L,D-transpeptidase family protein [Maritimibacter]EAQ13631.1 peptidoglycan binding protein, putative [Maritimibacter alkaliphilus HTCC2654]TYP83469.1 murein L,D-transpeptidase YcbB/YkuD [Maritimibacter alkaliphilus HTCC2654]